MPTLNPRRSPAGVQGVTLVELLIAVTLGLLALAVMVGVFVSNSQNYRQNDAITALQDNARFAMDNLSRDLAMAGYWGGVRPIDASLSVLVSAEAAAAVSPTATPGDCGPATSRADGRWLFNASDALEFRNHLDSTAITSRFHCLNAVQGQTDVVMIRRVSGQAARELGSGASTTLALTEGRFYLKTNQSVASLFRFSSANGNVSQPMDCSDPQTGIVIGCPPQELPMQLYAYTPRIYFVHNVSGDVKVPTLCRYVLRDDLAGQTPAMEEDCLAEGVENLQLEWGIAGTTLDGNGEETIDRYLSSPTQAELARARSVRIHLLVRAADPKASASDATKAYEQLADYNCDDDSSFVGTGVLRRAFTTTIQIKNFRQ